MSELLSWPPGGVVLCLRGKVVKLQCYANLFHDHEKTALDKNFLFVGLFSPFIELSNHVNVECIIEH